MVGFAQTSAKMEELVLLQAMTAEIFSNLSPFYAGLHDAKIPILVSDRGSWILTGLWAGL